MTSSSVPGAESLEDCGNIEEQALRELYIADYCAEHENFYFVDGTDSMLTDSGDAAMQTGDGRYFNPAIFKSDGIHLTQEGHDLWTPYMTAALAEAGFPAKS